MCGKFTRAKCIIDKTIKFCQKKCQMKSLFFLTSLTIPALLADIVLYLRVVRIILYVHINRKTIQIHNDADFSRYKFTYVGDIIVKILAHILVEF
jgi:hypothetical protein